MILLDEDDFTHYFKATARLSIENKRLREELASERQRIKTAISLLKIGTVPSDHTWNRAIDAAINSIE